MSRILLVLAVFTLALGACNKTPEHAQYLPKDALIVAEINTKQITQKMAWELLTNRGLWDKLFNSDKGKDTTQLDFIKNMEEAGVDQLNTFYAYMKNTEAGENNACFIVLIPLKNAEKFEKFVHATFEDATIIEKSKRKEAKLADDIYVGWTNNLLIVVSTQETDLYANPFQEDDNSTSALVSNQDEILAESLNKAFSTTKEQSLLSDKRFEKFEKNKHDLGFWINIDAIMNSYGAKNLALVSGGVSLSNAMWRNSAFTAALNFEKGKVVTDMTMYSSDELAEINKLYKPKAIDQDIVNRLPNKGLDYVIAYNMSTEGTLKTVEKMGLLGIINLYLNEHQIKFEEVLGSLTGDMAFSMNNFTQTKTSFLFDSLDASSEITTYNSTFDLLFALKLHNKESFKKVLNLATNLQMLEEIGTDTYKMKGNTDSSLILINNEYAVFANKSILAQDYLSGKHTTQTPLAIKKYIFQHPFGAYFDYQNWASNVSDIMTSTPADSLVYATSLNTFESFVFNGGALESDNTYKYQMSINFKNKKENSLKLLLDFAEGVQKSDELRNAAYQKAIEDMDADSNYFQ